MVISLIIITLLWVMSVFSFARLRIALSKKNSAVIRPHNDWVCLAYLRVSGIFILYVIFSLVNRL